MHGGSRPCSGNRLRVGLFVRRPSGDLEILEAADGDDELWGNDESNEIWGREGDDEIHGLGGNDVIKGAKGKDRTFGGAGKDQLNVLPEDEANAEKN